MNENLPMISAPSLYWFAYGYCKGLVISGEHNSPLDRAWVREQYQNIYDAFGVESDWEIRDEHPATHFNLLANPDERTNGKCKFIQTEEGLKGFIYPQLIHDAYVLNFNIYCPEKKAKKTEYKIEELGEFNPKNCFQPCLNQPLGYLGKTLLLSCYLRSQPNNIHELDEVAKRCWLNFFHLETPEKFPPLYRAYNLFGGYLYEYGNPKADLNTNPYGHLLIWFLFEEEPSLRLKKCYWELPELLLYYHKICKTFQDSRIFYRQADEMITNNENDLNSVNQWEFVGCQTEDEAHYASHQPLSEYDLKTLKTTLKKLLKTSLDYSKQLRNLEYARNTIAINTKNYQDLLKYMEKLAETSMEGFQTFVNKDAISFQEQISADLTYFNQGSTLLNQAIANIRGLVEIDQAERDRQRYKQDRERYQQEQERYQQEEKLEKERDRRSQTVIFMAGTGITVGGIIASTSAHVSSKNPVYFPGQEGASDQPHPFVIYSLVSIGASIIAALLAAMIAEWWFERKNR